MERESLVILAALLFGACNGARCGGASPSKLAAKETASTKASTSATPSATTAASGDVPAKSTAIATTTTPAPPIALGLVEACGEIARLECAGIARFGHDAILGWVGDDAACRKRFASLCVLDASPASGMSLDVARACIARLPTLGDEDWRRFTEGDDVCVIPPGNVADGGVCARDGECASGHCDHSAGSTYDPACGLCATLPKEGAECDSFCAKGLACVDERCVVWPREGPCGEAGCAAGRACLGGRCIADVGEGKACDPQGKTAPGCDALLSLTCTETEPHVCVPVTLVGEGQACSESGPFTIRCRGDLECRGGVCLPYLPIGAACDTSSKARRCEPASSCLDGVCKLPSIEDCRAKAGHG